MIQYACDTCGALKRPEEEWILGFAAETVGITAARREVTIAPAWDAQRACAWLAVHFCSEQCKDDYLTKVFARDLIEPESTKPPGKVVTMRRGRKRKRA